jgi:hypothetical protein
MGAARVPTAALLVTRARHARGRGAGWGGAIHGAPVPGTAVCTKFSTHSLGCTSIRVIHRAELDNNWYKRVRLTVLLVKKLYLLIYLA